MRYKALGLRTPRDTKEAEILPELAPEGDELVISKVTSSAFHSTNIDRLLRNLGIRNLIITGVVTNGCVESTARSAAEYDYGTIVVEDATAAMAPQLHEHSILSMSYKGRGYQVNGRSDKASRRLYELLPEALSGMPLLQWRVCLVVHLRVSPGGRLHHICQPLGVVLRAVHSQRRDLHRFLQRYVNKDRGFHVRAFKVESGLLTQLLRERHVKQPRRRIRHSKRYR